MTEDGALYLMTRHFSLFIFFLDLMMLALFIALTLILSTIKGNQGYLPVVMFHGFSGSTNDFNDAISWINASHPGTLAVSLNIFNNASSEYTPLWTQVDGVRKAISDLAHSNSAQFSNGFHLIGHSQGALATRAYLMTTPSHNVSHYISLSGPHVGQYGAAGWTKYPNLTTEDAWKLFYTQDGQDHISCASYWCDPLHQDLYLQRCVFLPVLNNLTNNPNATEFKRNFIATKMVYLFGSPQDGIIVPWQSAFFGAFKANTTDVVVPMQQQDIYTGDYFGLKTLSQSGRLVSNIVPNVEHSDWIDNETIFNKYVLPLLN